MKGIHVDPARRTVRAQAGVTVGELDRATAAFGLATPERRRLEHRDRRPHARRRSRLADGQVRDGGRQPALRRGGARVGRGRRPPATTPIADLFWAIRGGGGQLRRRDLVRVPRAPGRERPGRRGVAPARGGAPSCFSFYREFAADLPDELATQAAFLHAPDGSGTKLCGVAICHAGDDPDRAEADVRPLREFGSPVADMIAAHALPHRQHGGRLAVPGGRRSTTGSRRSSRTSRILASR